MATARKFGSLSQRLTLRATGEGMKVGEQITDAERRFVHLPSAMKRKDGAGPDQRRPLSRCQHAGLFASAGEQIALNQ
jgi:hypothetical protein